VLTANKLFTRSKKTIFFSNTPWVINLEAVPGKNEEAKLACQPVGNDWIEN
jgi:hypothetical protein